MGEPVVLPSAHKHGLDTDQILHAYRHRVIEIAEREDFTMAVGVDHAGRWIEVGVLDTTLGLVAIHAMFARPKYLHRLR